MTSRRGHPTEDRETVRLGGDEAAPRRVLVVLGAGIDQSHPLPATGAITIGRLRECDVVIPDPSVSRRHLRMHLGPLMRCEDLGGMNPPRVRGRRLARGESVELAVGEVIEVGRTLLVVRAAGEPIDAQSSTKGPDAPHRPPSSSRGPVVVVDPAMQRIYRLVERVARGDVPILILGETGVGKDVIAEALHRYSPRAAKPFVRLNCAALPAALLESELFGHERGAFTGADRPQVGLLESGNGGTVFLDEIGDFPLALQASLLRVLEDRAVLPVGGRKPRPLDVRWVSATNRDLHAEVERGTFRRDLYHRLNGVSFAVPPLRERSEIEALAAAFAAEAGPGGTAVTLSAEALAALRAYAWPGNVRELRHVISGAALLCGGGPILVEHLPAEVRATPRPAETAPARPPPGPEAQDLRAELATVERRRIVEALRACDGNQTRAAEALGMSRRTLVKRIGEYGITRGRRLPED